jgi:hypothetical protein
MGMGRAAARHLACRHDLPHAAIVAFLGWWSEMARDRSARVVPTQHRRCDGMLP